MSGPTGPPGDTEVENSSQFYSRVTIPDHDISGFEEMYHNVFGDGATWNNNDYHIQADFFFRRKTQKLCQGTVSAMLSASTHFYLSYVLIIFSMKDLQV